MRRRLLAVAALTAAGLATTALFPPIVAGEEYESTTPEPAWRWLFPTHLEWAWIGDGRLHLPDVGELVPWRIVCPRRRARSTRESGRRRAGLGEEGAQLARAGVVAEEREGGLERGDGLGGASGRL